MSEHGLFDVKDVREERDAVALAIFYRDLLAAVSDVEDMLAGYLAHSGAEFFVVGSVVVQKKEGARAYDHRAGAEEFALVSDTAAKKVQRAIDENTVPRVSWSKVTAACGLKVSDLSFTQADPVIEFRIDGKKVNSVPFADHPDKGPDYGEGPVQPAPDPKVYSEDEIPF